MVDQIEAKPTEYGRRMFKSRLEARWAVFLDHQPLTWVYEPSGFHDEETGWDYTPDFAIQFENPKVSVFLEIKPLIPTDEYLAVLEKFITPLGTPLWLCWGTFYKTVPNVCNLSTTKLTVKGITRASVSLERCRPFIRPDQAIKAAATFRFDLPQK